LLAQREIQLTKSLGQNFLHDGNQLRRIVKAAELKKRTKSLKSGRDWVRSPNYFWKRR